MQRNFSYRHLYYFWVVAREGGVTKAAYRLGMAIQTVSAQVRELERELGYALLKPAGRGLALTAAGQAALHLADQIFQLGERLPELVRDAAGNRSLRLSVGISDGVPKLATSWLLKPALGHEHLHLICHEGEFDDLLGDLALHRLDMVLADRPAPSNANLKLYSHALGQSAIAWYGPAALHAQARREFPQSLTRTPVLLPTVHVSVRAQLDLWFGRCGIKPKIVGEFEDSAMLATFGAAGLGVFPAAEIVEKHLMEKQGLRRIGICEGVEERFFAIGTERKVAHPLVQQIIGSRLKAG
ncbi:MAG: LysR family transcriptional regulator [Burkholderiales bacterium]|nr:LysR family transcriptional regulator [Burkholderiales bacterium]